MTQSQRSKLVDPFQGKSILSLHPRSFRDFKVSLKSNDLEAIHQHMSLMALRNPDKHFEEARSIIDGGSEFLNAMENYEPNMKENENPQKNRPALARKRAKFSMKPDTSQHSTIVEPTFQMDQLHDPEDFFAAYEKFENTVKELKRQRGEDPNEPNVSTTARQRRPEIPRRKSSYKHHVYSSQPENDTLFSQETLQDSIESQSQPAHDSQNESAIPNCQSKEKDGSISKAEDRVGKLFDDLMSSNISNLDGNEALSYLKDRLKIKPVAVNDFQLPNFHDIPTVNLFPSVNLIKDTLGKQKITSDKPLIPISSPTPPRSPFLAISTFGKLISKSMESELNDPFSANVTDLFPTTTTSEIISWPSTHANKDQEFPVSARKDNLLEPIISMENCKQGHNMEEMDEDIQGNAEDMVEKAPSPTKHNLNVEDIINTKRNLNVEDIIDNLHCEQDIGENVEDAAEKVVSSLSPEENVEITTIKESESNCFHSAQSNDGSINIQDASVLIQKPNIVQEQLTEEHPKTTMNNGKKTRANKINQKKKQDSVAAQTNGRSINIRDASVPVQDPNIVPEQQTEEHSKTSMENKRKTRGSKIDQNMKRRSLAGSGSCWTTGVRRSNRIKSKPLEYWRGERPLYARVHNSLPTLVGVKYLSPTGKTGFKVESFVADEYKDLVELISLH